MATYNVKLYGQNEPIPVEAPDNATEDQIVELALQKAKQVSLAPTAVQETLASAPVRLLKGGKDMIDAGAQVLPRVGSFVSSAGGLAPNAVSEWFDKEAASVDKDIADSEMQYQGARKATGQTGMDWWRLGGNVLSPVNMGIAASVPLKAATTLQRFLGGGALGALGGLTQPVTDTTQTPFAVQKAGQIGAGAVGGALLTPVLGKLVDAVVPRVSAVFQRFKDPVVADARAAVEADAAIRKVLLDAGIDEGSIPPAILRSVSGQIRNAAKRGYSIDPAALLRKADFESQGVPFMGFQASRDPAAYSRAMNLRGVELPGAEKNPIQAVLEAQNRQITTKVGALGGPRAADPTIAGRGMASALKAGDEAERRAVSGMYSAARESADAAAEVPAPSLAQRVGEILDDFGVGGEPNSVPSAVYSRLKSFGFVGDDGMTQRKVFDFDAADKLLKQINAHDARGGNASLTALRAAVKEAMTEAPSGTMDPFSAGRAAARARFAKHDAVPVLEKLANATDAADVERIGDEFVSRYILNAKPSDVRRMFELLPSQQKEEARRQVARKVYEAVFGQNAAGDKTARVESFQTGLNRIGVEKLKVFFTDKQVEDLQTLARINAYIWQDPAASTVSRGSNLGGAMFNQLLQLTPAQGVTASVLNTVLNPAVKSIAMKRALSPSIPQTANVPPQIAELIENAIKAGGIGSGAATTGLLSLPYQ